jgi:hypothetical protein
MAAKGEESEWAKAWNPGGNSVIRSPCDIQTGRDAGRPAKRSESEE